MARHGSVMFGWNWTEASVLGSQATYRLKLPRGQLSEDIVLCVVYHYSMLTNMFTI